jgi:putative membrane protein
MYGDIMSYCGNFFNDGNWGHMMYGYGFPFIGYWGIGIWLVQLLIGLMIYKDAEKIGKSGVIWFILTIIPWIGLFAILAYIIFRNEDKMNKDVKQDSIKVLDERYAKGEISREEYLQAKKDIENS